MAIVFTFQAILPIPYSTTHHHIESYPPPQLELGAPFQQLSQQSNSPPPIPFEEWWLPRERTSAGRERLERTLEAESKRCPRSMTERSRCSPPTGTCKSFSRDAQIASARGSDVRSNSRKPVISLLFPRPLVRPAAPDEHLWLTYMLFFSGFAPTGSRWSTPWRR